MLINTVFWFVGCSFLSFKLYELLKILYSHFRSLQSTLKRYKTSSEQNETHAIITGSTDGIGKGNAIVLAREGFNIIQISRNQKKLEQVEKELLEVNPNIKVINICMDMTQPDFSILESELKYLDISLLINNVGVGEGGQFEHMKNEEIERLITLNIKCIVYMSKIVISNYLSNNNQKNHRLGIINLSSMCGTIPQGFGALYSASKAFDDFFSRSLSQEYSNKKIDILSLRSLIVDTPAINEGTKKGSTTSKFGAISPIQSAEGALKWLGLANYSNGHISHSLQSFLVYNLVPKWIFEKIFAAQSYQFYKTANEVRAKNK